MCIYTYIYIYIYIYINNRCASCGAAPQVAPEARGAVPATGVDVLGQHAGLRLGREGRQGQGQGSERWRARA